MIVVEIVLLGLSVIGIALFTVKVMTMGEPLRSAPTSQAHRPVQPLARPAHTAGEESTGPRRYPVRRGEKIVLALLGVGIVLLLVSLAGPWWHDADLGNLSAFAQSRLGLSDRKGVMILVLFVIALCLLLRFVTPVRPAWFYPVITVVAFIGWVSVGTLHSGDPTITASPFMVVAGFGSLLAAITGVSGFIVGLRQPRRVRVAEPTVVVLEQVSAPAAGGSQSTAETLRELAHLREEGHITESEFEAKKQDLLSRM